MKKQKYSGFNLCIMAVFISSGLMLQYIESQFAALSVPGGKLGLANIVSIINIFMFGGKNAMLIAALRAFIGALLTGGMSAVPYSVAGAFMSTAVMWLCKRFLYPKVSMIGMGVVGAVMHNIAQLCVAAITLTSMYVFSYLPLLLVLAAVSGMATGYTAQIIGNRVLKIYRRTA